MFSEKKISLIVALLVAISLLCWAADDDSEVVKAQRYHKQIWGHNYGCAVVVTLKNNERWFINKQQVKGKNGNVAIDGNIRKNYNKLIATKNVTEATIMDYIRAAGKKYSILTDNSFHACDRMMAIA